MAIKKKSKAKVTVKLKAKKPVLIRDIILKQLRDKGYQVEVDSLSDKSASWIVMSKVPRSMRSEEGKEQLIHITFNYEGTVITDIQYTEEYFRLQTAGQKVIY